MRTIEDLRAESCEWRLGWGQDVVPFERAKEFVLGGVGKGWHPFLTMLIEQMNLWCKEAHITQVKEKFGTLRFYTAAVVLKDNLEGWAVPDFEAWIHFAEEVSGYYCETCGAPGTRRDTGWIKTLCDTCNEGEQ